MRVTNEPILLGKGKTIGRGRLWLARSFIVIMVIGGIGQRPPLFNIHLPARSLGALLGIGLVYAGLISVLAKPSEEARHEKATSE